MYVRYIWIDPAKCIATNCEICTMKAPAVFAIDSGTGTKQATVIAATPLTDPVDEEGAGYAIQTCPKQAIWGRGEGEITGQIHDPT